MEIKELVTTKAKEAKNAARVMAYIDSDVKNKALSAMAEGLIKNKENIKKANSLDMENGKEKGLSNSLLDRLLLNDARIDSMAQGLMDVSKLEDPIGETIRGWKNEDKLDIAQMRVPLGVIGIIYEARPNVTVDAAALCIKSGNAVILKGGSEALNSNKAIVEVIYEAGIKAGLPDGFIEFLDIKDREAVNVLMKLNTYVDVIIPRGGAGLIKNVVENSTVPVIETGVGNCHVFVDESAKIKEAINIIVNAKTQRPGVCNAMETLLVHEKIAKEFLPLLHEELKKFKVEIRGCKVTNSILKDIKEAEESDWEAEFLDLILAVKVVKSIDEAIDHIYEYSTKHSEAIITENYSNAQKFLKEVDAAAVYVNASTRFTDGGKFGFGGEIGISTQKLHARGPMGLRELTSTKYIIYGNGQIRNK
ncbi:glutamate-5-semialdehyde dehydrogenase [Clostridium sp. 19966]|uniref:glutamate-5-semialdehyde dehydrogenase n=1 Tax=Clostridium sp. 19966 TaxID=2768166 RepID=UPI0028DFA5C9|nr:glutamate-5-semialdehyde dehydrogenase [Clostridium sp. 19966]MDT8715197.1 glutamate-5-semialdehyde dehydrogenase [Clostridium sp. 19966]